MPRRLQSVLALLAGFVLIVIMAFTADAMFILPDNRHELARFVLASWMVLLVTAGGGYVTARLAPRRPLRHALELGFLVTLLMAMMCWRDPFPRDAIYLVELIIIMPAAWLGGTLGKHRLFSV